MRKTQWKRILVGALAVSMIAGNCAPAFAAGSGWKQNNTGWWYQNTNGTYKTNTWFQDGNDWYYFDGNGYMATGWLQDSTKNWYYLNPISNGKKGSMQTGWVQDGDKWYYLNSKAGGALQTGWINDGGKWYFANSSGVMQSGVISVDGVVYYLNPNSDGTKGAMMVGTYTIDGKTYTFGDNGASIGIAPAATVAFNSNGTTISSYASSSDSSSSSSSSSSGGSYSSSSTKKGNEYKNGDLYIRKAGTINAETLKALNAEGKEIQNVYISSTVGEGDVDLEDLDVNGDVFVRGGGSNTVTLKNCKIKGKLATDKLEGKQVHVLLSGNTTVAKVEVKRTAKIEIGSSTVKINTIVLNDIASVVLSEKDAEGNEIKVEIEIPVIIVETTKKVEVSVPVTTLEVNKANDQVVVNTEVKNVIVNAPAEIKLEDGAKVEKIEVGESAKGTSITASGTAKVETVVAGANCSIPGGTKVEVTNKEIEITDSNSKTNEKIEISEENIIERFKLTIGEYNHATASLDTKLVSEKDTATLTIVPELGYEVTEVTADGATVGALEEPEDGVVTTTITGVTKDTQIEIKVEKITDDKEDESTTDKEDESTTDKEDESTDGSENETGEFTITAAGKAVSGGSLVYTIKIKGKTVTDSAINLKAVKGDTVEVTAQVVGNGASYAVKLTVTGATDTNEAEDGVSFTMPEGNVTIEAELTEKK